MSKCSEPTPLAAGNVSRLSLPQVPSARGAAHLAPEALRPSTQRVTDAVNRLLRSSDSKQELPPTDLAAAPRAHAHQPPPPLVPPPAGGTRSGEVKALLASLEHALEMTESQHSRDVPAAQSPACASHGPPATQPRLGNARPALPAASSRRVRSMASTSMAVRTLMGSRSTERAAVRSKGTVGISVAEVQRDEALRRGVSQVFGL